MGALGKTPPFQAFLLETNGCFRQTSEVSQDWQSEPLTTISSGPNVVSPQDFVVPRVFHTRYGRPEALLPVFDTIDPSFPRFFHSTDWENTADDPTLIALRGVLHL